MDFDQEESGDIQQPQNEEINQIEGSDDVEQEIQGINDKSLDEDGSIT